jgi:c(7)-type cytochrome triheme protein
MRTPLIGLCIGLLCMTAAAQRVPTFTYRGGGQGPVTFDHQLHASRGLVCADCHTRLAATGEQLFQTRKEGLISAADHVGGAKCFACHNGTVAFSSCAQCHR